MAERADCKWRHHPASHSVCHMCNGRLILNNKPHCPFLLNGDPKPEFQHLVTADERLYSIQLKAKQEE